METNAQDRVAGFGSLQGSTCSWWCLGTAEPAWSAEGLQRSGSFLFGGRATFMAAYSTGADVRWTLQCSPSFRRGPGLSSQPSPAGGCGSLAFLSSPALCAGLVLRGCAWWAAGALEGAQRLGEASRPSLRTCRAALESPGRLTRCPAPHRRPPGPAPQGGLRTPGRQGPRDSGAPEKPRNRAPSRGGSCLPNPRAHLNRAAGRAAGGREMQGSQRGDGG